MTIIYDINKTTGERSLLPVDGKYHRRGNDYEAFQKIDISAVVYFYSDGRRCHGDGRKQWPV